MRRITAVMTALACLAPLCARAQTTATPQRVADFYGPMPTGVSVSHKGRIFVNFPRWGDKVPYTVAELKNGRTVPFPDAGTNRLNRRRPNDCLVSVQSIVVDPKDRLWLLDTGSIKFGPSQAGGPKMVCVDLTTNQVSKIIYFSRKVVPSTSYLNDVRFDLRRGRGGMAFITDSGEHGPNGIVVVDLATGRSWRRLAYDASVRAVPHFLPIVEGLPLFNRPKRAPASALKLGSDGIAISANGQRLFYCPLASRDLYSVSVAALVDRNLSNSQVAETVKAEGDKGGASDGLESDAAGHIYATDYEHHAIRRGAASGPYEIFVVSPHVYDWPDTMSVATNGYLYYTANQLQRQANYHRGRDLRRRPFTLYRVRIDEKPVLLR